MKIINYLFISKVRIEIMKLFFLKNNSRLHIREITRITGQELNAVRRELLRLAEISLLESEKKGNRVNYFLNKEFLLYDELESIMFKCFGIGGAILESKSTLGNIDLAFLLEPYLDKRESTQDELDLVIVGEVDLNRVESMVQRIQKEDGREINYTVLKKMDFDLRIRRKDTMAWKWVMRKKIEIIGSLSEQLKVLA
jgi:hypothetical protein